MMKHVTAKNKIIIVGMIENVVANDPKFKRKFSTS
jgi:hypothetical protein